MVPLHQHHCIKNLLTAMQSLNAVVLFYCHYLPYWAVQAAVLKNAFYRLWHGAVGFNLWNKGGGGPKMLVN
jgi:hypothetical protein